MFKSKVQLIRNNSLIFHIVASKRRNYLHIKCDYRINLLIINIIHSITAQKYKTNERNLLKAFFSTVRFPDCMKHK